MAEIMNFPPRSGTPSEEKRRDLFDGIEKSIGRVQQLTSAIAFATAHIDASPVPESATPIREVADVINEILDEAVDRLDDLRGLLDADAAAANEAPTA